MSSYEYYDLFVKAQDKGLYNMFIFDIKDSKAMDSSYRSIIQHKMVDLILSIYNDIKELENRFNKKILVTDEGIVHLYEARKNMYKFGMLHEPFILGDAFGFTIYRDSLDKDVILGLFEKHKERLQIDCEVHFKDGYYETNDYSKGNKLFFRGYCIDILSNYHKFYSKKK